jgi:bifunctional non-homologous end joining protein LigD
MTKPMLPTLTFQVPLGDVWVYEIKYDGYRGTLYIDTSTIKLESRNENKLNDQFPEIIDFCLEKSDDLKPFLPLQLDGEICILDTPFKANFEQIQHRGRLKNKTTINQMINMKSSHYLVFDLLIINGEAITHLPFKERKERLAALFHQLSIPLTIEDSAENKLQYIPYQVDFDSIWITVKQYDSEGIIAKNINGKWEADKRVDTWLKFKNWKHGSFFVTGLDKSNHFIHIAVMRDGNVFPAGLFSHGLKPEEREALTQIIKNNSVNETNNFIRVKPGLCVELMFLELYKEEVRHPLFSKFLFDKNWEECTWEQLLLDIKPFPKQVSITHPDKPLWNEKNFTKQNYLDYLVAISPYMLPFLKNRLLTVIRYPHGMYGEKFYQKNCPDYAPDMIKTELHGGIHYIICNDVETLAWLGNQLAFEFHIPFDTIHSNGPSEIVFDLDPPSRADFSLAIQAAIILKKVFDGLKLISFLKTSGSKGLQLYIPLPENTFTYDETRVFTTFIANYLISKEPSMFTIERLKKNRHNRLYIDYVQHAEGKTIIAPYSVRGNKGGYVATPLFWEEVNMGLSIEQFPIEHIMERITKNGCPFKNYFQAKNNQPFQPVLNFIKSQK